MNLQCAYLRLAVPSTPPAPFVQNLVQQLPRVANDNQAVWPFLPFPRGWYASN